MLLLLLAAPSFGRTCVSALVSETARPLDLHPTQLYVGHREAEVKRDKLLQMSERQRELYLLGKALPVVRGPGGRLYLIDGHHLALAAHWAAIAEIPVVILNDWSHVGNRRFWRKMVRAGYVYLRHSNGSAVDPSQLGQDVTDCEDDEYRSLAYFVRKLKGYKKKKRPYSEFIWANFFRFRVPLDQMDFDAAVRLAVQVAHSPDAKHLPGYQPAP